MTASRPVGMLASYPTSKTLIFEGAYTGQSTPWVINIYEANKVKQNPAPIATITDALDDPYALAMDSSGTLYVANLLNSTVTEYPKGQTMHTLTITNGVNYPTGAGIDPSGILYVSNETAPSSNYNGYVSEYAPGSQAPFQTVTGFGGSLTAETLDKDGNLYVGWASASSGTYDVIEVPNGSTKIVHLNLKGLASAPQGLAFDASGRLWATISAQSEILIYKLPGQSPVKKIRNKLIPSPYWISVDPGGAVFIDSDGSPKVGPSVNAFKPDATKPFAVLTNSVYYPYGLLVAKP